MIKIQRMSPNRGPTKLVAEWGEEKWRQAKLVTSFILQAHFDEGAVAICYGVRRRAERTKIYVRFLRAAQGDIRKITNKIIKTQ